MTEDPEEAPGQAGAVIPKRMHLFSAIFLLLMLAVVPFEVRHAHFFLVCHNAGTAENRLGDPRGLHDSIRCRLEGVKKIHDGALLGFINTNVLISPRYGAKKL